MAAIDMSILKIYIKIIKQVSFFFTSKKILNMSLRYFESVVKRSCISITNVLSVTANNTLTTKPILKKFCLKNKCHFLPNKKFCLVLSHISIFVCNAS